MSLTVKYHGYSFVLDESDILNPYDYFLGYANTLWVVHDHGIIIGVCCALNRQEALDELADHGKLDAFILAYNDNRGTSLGVDDIFYDISSLDSFSISLQKLSILSQFNCEILYIK